MNPNNKLLETVYSNAINVRNTELSAYWTRYNIQAVLNLGLLAVVISDKIGSNCISKYIAGVCLILTIIWIVFILISKCFLIPRWQKYIMNLEKEFPVPLRFFTIIEKSEGRNSIKKHILNLNIPALAIPILCFIVWIWILFR